MLESLGLIPGSAQMPCFALAMSFTHLQIQDKDYPLPLYNDFFDLRSSLWWKMLGSQMGKTAQANETGFQMTEDIAGGHHSPKNPEHRGYC